MDNDTKLINLALDAGEIMLKNGAETFRVQDTMKRILSTTGREKIEAVSAPVPSILKRSARSMICPAPLFRAKSLWMKPLSV